MTSCQTGQGSDACHDVASMCNFLGSAGAHDVGVCTACGNLTEPQVCSHVCVVHRLPYDPVSTLEGAQVVRAPGQGRTGGRGGRGVVRR